MTLEQRIRYAAVLRNPPYPEDRNFLYNTVVKWDGTEEWKSTSTKCTCSIGAIYCVLVKDIFAEAANQRPMTDKCCEQLHINDQEMETIMLLNMLGGYAAVAEWLETGLVPQACQLHMGKGFDA